MLRTDEIISIERVSAVEFNQYNLNTLKKKHSAERSQSKPVTFALQYFGEAYTLVNNSGFSLHEAESIIKNYKTLYKVSEQYKQDRLEQATYDGYVTVAFGLRVRTPVLAKSILNTSKTPYQAKAEFRSAGNSMFQSYGMLTNRALNEFMERVWKSEYSLDIFPVATIHDAIYLVIKDNINVVKWVNDNLAECMSWQELPELQHDKIKLTAELGLFYPNWANEITLPNKASRKQIKEIVLSHK